jgi:hypothetical protein
MRRGAVFVLLTLAALLAAACTASSQPAARSQPTTAASNTAQAGAASSGACAAQPPISPLPVWARSGFTPPDRAMPHVLGDSGNIVAILWVPRDALQSPPPQDRNNKILWVSRLPLNEPVPLVIHATLAGTTRTATLTLPQGPGPSYVNLPAPGCWTLHLSWSGHTDELHLRYVS